jgi:hypothetical protein
MPHPHMPLPQGMYGQPPVQQAPPPQPYYRGPAPPAPPQNMPPQVKDLGIDSNHQVGPKPHSRIILGRLLINFKTANVIPSVTADA